MDIDLKLSVNARLVKNLILCGKQHSVVHQAKKNMLAGVKKSMAIENDRKRPALSVVDTCRYIMLRKSIYLLRKN